ncbi:hypothetical protein [Nonomuraea guangzhouensis]|uniref:WxL domain-containing protein n=1 Tax=Nonomuraea guangzhouensis TaxID=1291555 RepID=A0ABW4GXU5_9ACTN|nr:hypothetical protein [Nonomuraea guangzhouensis]
MRTFASLMASIVVSLGLAAPAAPAAAAGAIGAATNSTFALHANTLTITVPASSNLGNGTHGNSLSAILGTITVEDGRNGSMTWTATVTSTNFTTGGGSAGETITKGNVSYWSGPTTFSSGGGSRFPGQLTPADKVPLSSPVTAFRGTKAPLATVTSWQPTLVVSVPIAAVLGRYTGVITHTVT